MAKKIRKGKKRWYPIQAPQVFDNQSLGETYVWETEELPGRRLTVNLMTLTGNPKKQNMNVFFEITKMEEGTAMTKTVGIEMQQSSVKRLARRGRSKVADSFITRTKKGQRVRVKPIIMTRTRADKDVQSALRKRCRELVVEAINKYSFATIVNDISRLKLQRHLKDQLNDIFPVRSVDIRFLKFVSAESEDEDEMEEITYPERVKPTKEKEEEAGLASLREELDEALAAEKEEVEAKERVSQGKKKQERKKKQASADASDEEKDLSEDESDLPDEDPEDSGAEAGTEAQGGAADADSDKGSAKE